MQDQLIIIQVKIISYSVSVTKTTQILTFIQTQILNKTIIRYHLKSIIHNPSKNTTLSYIIIQIQVKITRHKLAPVFVQFTKNNSDYQFISNKNYT